MNVALGPKIEMPTPVTSPVMETAFTSHKVKTINSLFKDAIRELNFDKMHTLLISEKRTGIKPWCLGFALGSAAETGRLDVVQEIIKSQNFDEVRVAKISLAFDWAIDNNHANVAEAMLVRKCYDKIDKVTLRANVTRAGQLGITLPPKSTS